MKKKYATSFKYGISLILTALLGVSVMAQVQPDKVRTVPTVEGDPATEFLIATCATDSVMRNHSFKPELHFTDNEIIVTTDNDYVAYQIISPSGGNFAALIGLASKITDAKVNVSVYKTVSGSFIMDGDTVNTYNGSWFEFSEHVFPFSLEANVNYTMRVSFLSGNTNMKSIRVLGMGSCGEPPTLSELSINGTPVTGFDPEIYEYHIALPLGSTNVNIQAESDDLCVSEPIAGTGNLEISSSKTTHVITVSSESGYQADYALNFYTPIEVFDALTLRLADDIYFNNGIEARNNNQLQWISAGDYVDYYVYSEYDGNFDLRISCTNGYEDAHSYLNVSTFALDDTTWVLNEDNTKYIPVTYDDNHEAQWIGKYAQDIDFAFTLKQNEPVLLRIYGITNKAVAADIFSLSFIEVYPCTNCTYLSDLKVNGATVAGFNSKVFSYDITMPAGEWIHSIEATASDSSIDVTIPEDLSQTGDSVSYVITLTSDIGFTQAYTLNVFASEAQKIQTDKVRIIPTVDGDPATEFLVASHATDSVMTFDRFEPELHFTDDEIILTSANDYVEYQLVSPTGGYFAAFIGLASNIPDAKVNVSVYETLSDSLVMLDDTVECYNGSWDEYSEYVFPFSVEAGDFYTLRICFLSGSTNMNSIRVSGLECCGHANLSDLKVDGVTVPGFNESIYSYTVNVPAGEWIRSIEAATDASDATISIPDDLNQKADSASYVVSITSAMGIIFHYTIHVISSDPQPLQPDKVRTVPTVEGDPSTEFRMLTHLCDSGLASDGTIPTITDSVIENLKAGAFVEYQIRTPIGADFAVNLSLSAEREDALVNVGIYKTETEVWPADGLGDTIRVACIRNMPRKERYVAPMSLEPDEVYTLRINFMNGDDREAICRLNGIAVTENTCCSYPSKLSDLRINGNTIPGFDPNITLYNVILDSAEWVDSINATTQESSASLTIVENLVKAGVNTTYILTVRSEYGFVMDYRVNVVVPVTQNYTA